MNGEGENGGLFQLNRHAGEWLKGLAILLMLAHHLFGLPTLVEPQNGYISVIPGLDVEYWIGRFGKICVAIFLLLSGYGFASRFAKNGEANWQYFIGKAWRFLLAYWPYFLLALVVGSVFFQERMSNGNLRFPTDPLGIAFNALTLKNSFAFEWWFAETYLVLVLLTKPLLSASRRPIVLLIGSLGAFGLGAIMDVAKFDPTVLSFANVLIWQLPWVAGILAATVKTNALVEKWSGKAMAALVLGGILASFIIIELVAAKAMTPFLILAAPFLVFALNRLFGTRSNLATRILAYLGSVTLGLWLVHPFFCYYFFQNWIYAPRFSPLIFLSLLLASLCVVVLVEGARSLLAGALVNLKGEEKAV